MTEYYHKKYSGKIKVVDGNNLCFPVNPETLDAESCGCYQPYPYDDTVPIEIISVDEWNLRVSQRLPEYAFKRKR